MLSGQPFWKQPIAAAVYAADHTPWLLKNPLHRQWRLSPVTDFLSPSTLSSLLRSFLCCLHLLCPSNAHHYLVSLLYFLFSSLSVSAALSLSTPSPVCCTCAGWSCWAEAEGVFVVNREGGEPTANTWPMFHEEMWRFRDWSPPALLQLFIPFSCITWNA